MSKKIVAITACAAGIAHTYMAAESLIKAASKKNYQMRVETQGSIGAETILSEEEIKNADVVIIAADIDVDMTRFMGKRVLETKSVEAIKSPEALIEKALNSAQEYHGKDKRHSKISLGKTDNQFIKHIMSGISYMVPMTIAAGLLLAIANIFAFQKDELGRIVNWGFDTSTQMGYFMSKLFYVGQVGFKLMIPLFAGFVANSIADKPAIAPAMIGAYLANDSEFLGTQAGGGFLSAILVAFIVGYMVKYLKRIHWPKVVQPLLAIMIIPLISTFLITIIVLFLIGQPIAFLMDSLYTGLTNLNNSYASAPFIIGAIIGAMIGFDLGGPVNKTAMVFGAAVFTDTVAKYGIQGANFVPGTAAQAAISVAPLGIWLASLMFKNKFTTDEKTAAKSAFSMGMVGVTEGAIPFAASNPLQIITASVVGSALAGGLVGIFNVKFYGGIGSPLGTFIGYIEQPIPFVTWIGSISAGILVTALIIGFWRKPIVEDVEGNEESLEVDDTFLIENIILDSTSSTKEEAFKQIAKLAFQNGYVLDETSFLEALHEREAEVTTGFNDGVAIPHGKSDTVIKPGIFVVRFKNPIEWSSLDGKPIVTAIALSIPLKGASTHMKILSQIATKLIDDDFRQSLTTTEDKNQLYKLIEQINLNHSS